jgi:hypothetical protein
VRSLVISCLHCFLFIPKKKGIDSSWKTTPSFKFPSFDSSSEICSPLSPLDKPLHQPPSSNLPLILQVLRKFSTTHTYQSPESPTQYPNLPTNLPNNPAAPTTFPLLLLHISSNTNNSPSLFTSPREEDFENLLRRFGATLQRQHTQQQQHQHRHNFNKPSRFTSLSNYRRVKFQHGV